MFKSKPERSKPIALLFMTAILCIVTIAAAAKGVAQAPSQPTFKSIVGSWALVDNQSGAAFFGTYNGGPLEGTVNFTSPDNSISLTHGSWKRTGPRAFADTDIAFIYDAQGKAGFKIKFKAEIELSADGDTAFFNYKFEVSLFDGTVVNSGASTATGTRINVEPL